MQPALTVGALARLAGVTPKTVRYYEAIGLLPAATRAENGYRRYPPEMAQRLAFVQRAKALGLTLDEVRALITASDDGACQLLTPALRDVLARKVDECDARIAELSALRASLRAAATRLADQEADCAGARSCACSAFQPGCDCLPHPTVATP